MVGITYDRFNPGEPCLIVIGSFPREYYLREQQECYLGEFMGNVSKKSYAQHRIARIVPSSAKAVRAKLIDPRVAEKNEQSLPFFKEPLCDYTVIPCYRHSASLEAKMGGERIR